MGVTVNWSRMGIGSVLAFLVGWFVFGLVGAVLLAIVAMLLLGIIKVK
jgi:hypothetical protein